MINLAIDIGNTRTKTALFDKENCIAQHILEVIDLGALKKVVYNQKVENVILSSTTQIPEEVDAFLKAHYHYLLLTEKTPVPLTINYKTPHTLGKDRIAAAAGANSLFPDHNCLVIDAGTCITADLVKAGGVFFGGNISPGIGMRLKAMHTFTGRLPEVRSQEVNWEDRGWLGDSTESAIRNGAQLGALLEIQGFIRLCEQEFGPLKILFTGGDANFFVKHIKTEIFAVSNLVLQGLNQILRYNVDIFEG